VFQFLEGVLDQVITQFPCSYIHIGGDEVPKVRWEECARCQARMDAEGLSTEAELQSWFVRRISNYLAAKGRKLIGETTRAMLLLVLVQGCVTAGWAWCTVAHHAKCMMCCLAAIYGS
jgi:N-acetyl-beta-hexosaminidase